MIFHIPHSSTYIPEDHCSYYKIDSDRLKQELLSMTDAFTDELFGAHVMPGDSKVVFQISRLVVDPERFIDDQDEPLSDIGMGVIYTSTLNGELLREVPPGVRESLIGQYYTPHHQALTKAAENEIQTTGRAFIVDCHSFPSRPLPYEKDQDPHRPDICVGVEEFHSDLRFCKALLDIIFKVGWTCEINRPFSGSIVPIKFYRKDNRVTSIMIEVNRRLYMNEVTGGKSNSFGDCLNCLGDVITGIRQIANSV
jgi:N-formylglutamate amidohydrolase